MDTPTPADRIAADIERIRELVERIATMPSVADAPAALTKIAARIETARLTLASVADDLLSLVPVIPEN